MPLNRNLPNNRTNDSLLLTLTDNLGAVNKVANCVDTSTNLLKVDIENATISGTGLATEPKQDDMVSLLQGQPPAGNRLKAIPVQIMVGDSGSQHSALRGVGGDLSVYIDDMNSDVAVNSGLATSSNQTDGSQKAQAMGTDGSSQYQLKTDTDGHLQVDVLTVPTTTVTGTITETNSTAILSDTDSLDSKITACNTGAVVVSSSVLPTGAATESTLNTLNGKVTACNTGAVVVSSSALPSGAATESTLSAAEAHLGTIDTSTAGIVASHYADGVAIGGSDTGVLVVGKDNSNNAHPIRITANGDVEVEIADFVKGQATKANSFPVVIASDQDTLATSSAQLPASLGQKANSGSVSICRSTTAGAFDMSARTTIGTASTTTKLLCSASGKLQVENTMTGVGFSSELTIMNNEAIASGATSGSSVAQVGNIRFAGALPSFSVIASVNDFDVSLFCSQDGTNFQEYGGVTNATSPQVFTSDNFDAPLVEYYVVSITNNSVGSANYTVKAGGIGLTMS